MCMVYVVCCTVVEEGRENGVEGGKSPANVI